MSSTACGPLLGGLLTEAWGWRAIFLVNLPVAVLAVALTLAVVTESASGGSGRVDVVGATTFTVASAALVWGLVSAGERGWGATATVLGLVLAAAALSAFVVVEHRSAAPMLDLTLFAHRSFTAIMVAAAVLSASAFAHLALVSLWLQTVLGLSPIRAGLVALPLSLAAFTVSAVAGRFLHGGSPARPIGGGLALIGVGALLMTVVDAGSGPWALVPGLVVAGLGVGLATPVLVSATLAVLPPWRAGVGSAAVNTFRQLGLAVGLAVLGTVFTGRIADVLSSGGVTDADTLATVVAGGGTPGVVAAAPVGARPQVAALLGEAVPAGLDAVFSSPASRPWWPRSSSPCWSARRAPSRRRTRPTVRPSAASDRAGRGPRARPRWRRRTTAGSTCGRRPGRSRSPGPPRRRSRRASAVRRRACRR